MDYILNMRAIGRRVAGKRVERGLTQQQLAKAASLTQRTIAILETGQKRSVSIEALAAVARVLGVGLDYLVYGEGDEGGDFEPATLVLVGA